MGRRLSEKAAELAGLAELVLVSLVDGVCRIPRPQLQGTWGTRVHC